MEAGTKLKVVGRAGVGVDNIDLEAATKRGIIVINAPDGNTITTCEHTFAMMMALPATYRKPTPKRSAEFGTANRSLASNFATKRWACSA